MLEVHMVHGRGDSAWIVVNVVAQCRDGSVGRGAIATLQRLQKGSDVICERVAAAVSAVLVVIRAAVTCAGPSRTGTRTASRSGPRTCRGGRPTICAGTSSATNTNATAGSRRCAGSRCPRRRGGGRRRAAGAVGNIGIRRDGDGPLGNVVNRRRRGHRRRRADIGAATNRDVVAADVVGVGDKALTGSGDLRLIGRQRGRYRRSKYP